MNKFIILIAFLSCSSAAPGLYFHETHVPVVHTISSPSKTTITKNSQVVNHGGHEVIHVPVHDTVHYVHEPVVHTPVVHTPVVHTPVVHEAAKSSQYFKLENTKYHVPKVEVHKVVAPLVPVVHSVHAPVVHSVHAPVVHAIHAPVVHAEVGRHGDSAVSHHSSTVHETVHEVKSVPLYSYHH